MKPFPTVNRDQLRTAAGIGISLLLHALLLLLFRSELPKPVEPSGSASRMPLVVELNRQPLARKSTPAPSAAPAPQPQPQAAKPPPVKPRSDKPVARKPATPRKPAPPRPTETPRLAEAPRPTETPRTPPAPPTQTAPPGDMSDMVAAARARRRAAGIPSPDDAPPDQDERPQGDEVARANIARSIAQARGRNGAGGVFQITNKGAREASFLFRGWDNDSRAGLREMVQVDAGPGGNVEDAIVRKMIEIIRKYQPGDFSWNSRRLGRVVTLSARREDNAGLEDFLKKEFF
jgi:outer membrane biosynthesis protein TonB